MYAQNILFSRVAQLPNRWCVEKDKFWRLTSPEGKVYCAVPVALVEGIFAAKTSTEPMPQGRRLKVARIGKGLTQKRLAEITGVSQGQISRIEKMKSGTQYLATIEKLFRAVESF